MTSNRLHDGSGGSGGLVPLPWGIRVADSAALSAILALFAAIGLALQWPTYLNHDVSWILYSTGRMIDGAVFGRDVIAANPPLAWFLSMPAVLVSKWSGWPVDDVFRIFIALAACAALAYCCRGMREERPAVRFAAIAVLAYLLFVGAARDYGQREHISLIFVLPYLLSSIGRAEGRRPHYLTAILIGVVAGLGLVLKPYFLAVPALVELVVMRQGRTLRSLIRTETVAIAATGLVYLVAVVVVTPEYLNTVIPLVSKVYWGFERSWLILFPKALPALLAFAALACLAMVGRLRTTTRVLLAAAGGYAIAYFVQFKGYSYHALPMNTLAIAAAACQLTDLGWSGDPRRGAGAGYRVAALMLAVLSLLPVTELTAVWYWTSRPGGELAREQDAVIDMVNAYARDDSFLAISTHPFPGFPTAIYVDSSWAGRTNSQIALPAVVKLRELGAAADPAALRQTEELARSMFLQDLSSAKPALLLVDARATQHAIGETHFDLLAFYRGDPEIDAILTDYEEMPEANGFRVFVRSGPR